MNPRALVAEALGTAVLLFVIVGSSFMAEGLGTDATSQLLAQAIAVGTALGAAIVVFQVVSGSHFNPAVTLATWRAKQMTGAEALGYVAAQCLGALVGVLIAHASFERTLITMSNIPRNGTGLIVAEAVATFILVLVILMLVRSDRANAVPIAIGAWVTAIVFATASTGFANPVVTIARTLTDSGAGIAPSSVVAFVAVELLAGLLAVPVATFLIPDEAIETTPVGATHAIDTH